VRRAGEVGLEQSLEFQERLVVKDDGVDLVEGLRPAHPRQYRAALAGKRASCLRRVKALLLRSRDHLPVDDEGRGSVMVVCGQARIRSRAILVRARPIY